jgi:carbon-monoxide dehydrogenase small subunit
MSQHPITLTVNGSTHSLTVAAHHTLLDVLRDEIGLTGTNEGCRMGDCGACTVLLNGLRVPACLVLAVSADGAVVQTIEGLTGEGVGNYHPLQEAFIRHGALQCGFCTPGMILSAAALLDEISERPLSEAAVREALTGNLCRCTGYAKIIDAILEVANGK